jgi:nucleoside-diphosphate-sugar epimerase
MIQCLPIVDLYCIYLMEQEHAPRVLVTGASGFIACHVIDLLLRSEKRYLVRGTVRDLKNEQKIKPLKDLAGEDLDRLELVEADLMREEIWDNAVKGCRYVMHVASPFPKSQPKDEGEVIKPALQGTRNVLNACVRNGVEHVVVTSSIVAIMSGNEDKNLFTDSDWTNMLSDKCNPYDKSKTLA